MKFTLFNISLIVSFIAIGCGGSHEDNGGKKKKEPWFDIKIEPVDLKIELRKPFSDGWYRVVDRHQGSIMSLGGGRIYNLDRTPIVTPANIETMTVDAPWPRIGSNWRINVQLDEAGREALALATAEHTGKDLVLVLNDEMVHEPIRINKKNTSGELVVFGKEPMSKEEAEELKDQIITDK